MNLRIRRLVHTIHLNIHTRSWWLSLRKKKMQVGSYIQLCNVTKLNATRINLRIHTNMHAIYPYLHSYSSLVAGGTHEKKMGKIWMQNVYRESVPICESENVE